MTKFRSLLLIAATSIAPSAGCGTNELGNVSSTRSAFTTEGVPKQAFNAELREACGDGGLTDAGSDAFVRRPYLQKVTDDAASILWTMPKQRSSELRVTTPDGALIHAGPAAVDPRVDRAEFDQYDTRAPGLEPATIYCYSILSDHETLLEPTGFRTAPATGAGDGIRIAVIGDLGTRTSDQLMIRDELENIAYDLVLVAGDLAYETGTLEDHEQNFFGVYGDLMRSIPFFVISGNHDYASDGSVFREVFSLFENGGPNGVERWYSFDWGPVHVAALDTELIGPEQAAWLDADLAATDQPWRIVLMHRPAFSSGWHGSTQSVQEHFVPVFERHGVQLAIAGHDHDFERTTPINGVTYIVIGSSGRGTRAVGASSFTAYSEAVAHFGHMTIGDGTMRINAIDATGSDFDSAEVSQH